MKKYVLIIFMLLATSAGPSCTQNTIPLLDEYTLSSRDSFPEGVTFDPVERKFYTGSLEGGTITSVDADGTESVFFSSEIELSFTGMKVDACNRRLWVCTSFTDPSIPTGEEGSRFGEIWIFSLTSGEKTHEYLLSDVVTNARCNDLIIDKKGIGYIPDSHKPNVHKINPNENDISLFASDPILDPEFTLPNVPRFLSPDLMV